MAAFKGHAVVVQFLVTEANANVNLAANDGRSPLCAATYMSHLEVVQWLAGHGGSVTQPNNDGCPPLWIAAYKGHLEVIQWLAGHGGSVTQLDNDGITPAAAATT